MIPIAMGEFEFVHFREFAYELEIGAAVLPEAVVEMGRDNTQIELLSFSELVDTEQQTDRICPARNRNDDRLPGKRQAEPAPFGDQIAGEAVHAGIIGDFYGKSAIAATRHYKRNGLN